MVNCMAIKYTGLEKKKKILIHKKNIYPNLKIVHLYFKTRYL